MNKSVKRSALWAGRGIVVFLFASAFMWRCANIAGPQGGPRDSLPPVIMNITPANGTVNFDQKRIYIEFDEYVKLTDQQKEFFVSPAMEKKPTLTIRGRGVQIDILDTLKPNTTYSLNFGSSISDNNEGNKLPGVRYIFSTGPTIDSMYMAGRTVSAEKGDTVSKTLIMFYDAAEVDSLYPDQDSTLLKLKPQAIARAMTNGVFFAQNLKPIDYRVYAVEDKNGNFTYEQEVDRVGYIDTVLNPLRMPDFTVRYDTSRLELVPEPQVQFSLFTEKAFKMQRLANSLRPEQKRIRFEFSAPEPEILSLRLDSLSEENYVWERMTERGDTLEVWLNAPAELLADTLKGELIYLKTDSVRNLVPDTAKLALFWKYVETEADKKAREEEEKARKEAEKYGEEYTPPAKPNPFKVTLNTQEVQPGREATLKFDAPLVSVDTSKMMLIRLGEENARYKARYTFAQDTADIHLWHIGASWQELGKYELQALPGAWVDSRGDSNDTTTLNLTVADPSKFGKINIRFTAKSDSSHYVIYLLNSTGSQTLDTKRVTGSGEVVFDFVKPADVKIRVLEDLNGNGTWDSGSVIFRQQPERAEIYSDNEGSETMTVKANWDIDLDMDMNRLFEPITTESIRREVAEQEQKRLEKLREQARQRELQRQQQEQKKSSGGGLGSFGSGLSSMSNATNAFR